MSRSAERSVIVFGGGVAGIAAAVRLAEEGYRIALYEKRASLGGRASSFVDHETGERVDNCQHVTMRCCTNLDDLYARVGVADRIHYFDELAFMDRSGRTSVIRGSGLPAPLHASASFARFGALGTRDKLAVARGLIAMLRAPFTADLDNVTMAAWAARTRQTPGAVNHFWRTILVSACNAGLDQVSCLAAFKVFRDGFLAHPQAYQMGLPTVRLADLYTEPAIRFLEAHEGVVHLRRGVEGLEVTDGRVTGVRLPDGTLVTADRYVSAVPFDLLPRLLPRQAAEEPYFGRLSRLRYAPITGVHLWFDRTLDAPEAVSLLDRPMQWIFNKTRTYARSGADSGGGTYLGLVVSAAQRYIDTPKEQLVEMALQDVRECVPGAGSAQLVKAHVIKEKKATFVPEPGAEDVRPDQRSPYPNLFVAGDWTQTGWPATMESAARSGYLAAERLLEADGVRKRLLVPDLPPSRLAAWLMRA